MEYSQEELQELITGIEPEVLEKEDVYAGQRPLLRQYPLADGRLVQERFDYIYPADSDAWAAASITLSMISNG